MSTTLSIPRGGPSSRRTQILATATALVIAVAVTVAFAMTAGGGGAQPAASRPVAKPVTAQPNPATRYRNRSALPGRQESQGGVSAADRFHHFH